MPGGLAIDLARRIPFEQPFARDPHAPGRARDRIQTVERLVRQAGEFERNLHQAPGSRVCDGCEVLPQQHLVRLAEQIEDGGAQGG